jgi:hypothetical protein
MKKVALPFENKIFPSSSKVIEGILLGEIAIQKGRILSHKEARKKLKRWLQ